MRVKIIFILFFVLSCQSISKTGIKCSENKFNLEYKSISKYTHSELRETYIDDFLILHYHFDKFKVILKDTLVEDYYSDDLQDTIFENDQYIILSRSYIKAFKKYKTKHDFSMYKVEMTDKTLVAPDFTGFEEYDDWFWFTEGVKSSCEDGINFAGHYTFARINCGCCCQLGVVINRLNGKIYGVFSFDEEYDSVYGIEFQKDSKMVFVNTSTIYGYYPGYYELTYVYPRKYIWNGNDFEKIE